MVMMGDTYPRLAGFQHLVNIPQSLLTLILNLFLHVGDPLLQVLDLILVQFDQVVHLLLYPLFSWTVIRAA